MVSTLDFNRFTPRTYIVSEGDSLSLRKAEELERRKAHPHTVGHLESLLRHYSDTFAAWEIWHFHSTQSEACASVTADYSSNGALVFGSFRVSYDVPANTCRRRTHCQRARNVFRPLHRGADQ